MHVDEEVLKKAFMGVFNALVENKEHFLEKWKVEMEDADVLKKHRLKMFIKILKPASKTGEFDECLCLKMLDQIKVFEGNKEITITFLDGTSMGCKI